ncbi:MAG: hypothetical protein KAH91_01490 [Thermoplasmatales archaeon]|nr:hypothetical protein [Thermoplasmatales archaeon]
MLIEAITIKLKKDGIGDCPNYTLTIYGDGKVIYNGTKNVKVQDIVKSSIDKEDLISLLSEFKESGFFSFNDEYPVEDSIKKPFTVISISIPKENREIAKKSVKYHFEDKNVPKEIISLENKIEAVVGASKWVDLPSVGKGVATKKEELKTLPISKKIDIPTKRKSKKRSRKFAAIAVALIIVTIVIISGLYTGLFNISTEDEDNTPDVVVTGEQLEISVLETASYIDLTTGDYTPETVFYKGDNITLYQEFKNFSTINDETCNLYLNITVTSDDVSYHQNSTTRSYIGRGIQIWWFTPGETWETGIYEITANLVDNVSNNSTSKKAIFVLI